MGRFLIWLIDVHDLVHSLSRYMNLADVKWTYLGTKGPLETFSSYGSMVMHMKREATRKDRWEEQEHLRVKIIEWMKGKKYDVWGQIWKVLLDSFFCLPASKLCCIRDYFDKKKIVLPFKQTFSEHKGEVPQSGGNGGQMGREERGGIWKMYPRKALRVGARGEGRGWGVLTFWFSLSLCGCGQMIPGVGQ